MTHTDTRYADAMRKALRLIEDAYDETNEREPLTRDPFWLRMWWRLVGMPQEVRRARIAERKRRASVLMEELYRRHPSRRVK